VPNEPAKAERKLPEIDKVNPAWYEFSRSSTRNTVFRFVGPLRVRGAENVPRTGATIIASLHVSELDPPAIGSATRRRLRFMAKVELFKGFFGRLIASYGAFPVHRGEADTEAIRRSLDYLAHGEALLLFPEGTRGDGKRLGPIGRGAALLAKRSGAWVVPTAITGTQFMLPKGAKKIKRGRVMVAFGKPFRYSDCGDDREAFLSRLEAEILALAHSIGLELEAPAEA
jgi:1-acyl-sn-glycerol-3-phosphate acyltransferase